MNKIRILLRKFKFWFEKWFLSEHMCIILRQWTHPPKFQKFWVGKPTLPAPDFERKYFEKTGLSSRIVRRLDDYRAAAFIKKEGELSLEGYGDYSSVQFGITPACSYDGRADRIIKFKIGSNETCVCDIPFDRWFDVRLDLSGNPDKLFVETDIPIAIAMPKGVFCHPKESIERKGKARHIIVLVLDAWTTEITNSIHPFTGEPTCFPNIERFFADGFKVNGASSGQWTLPSVGSLFTGLHLASHRMFHPRRWQEFPQDLKTLPEYFQQKGFHTIAGSAVSRVTPAFGHSRGFDRFLYHFIYPQLSYQRYDPASWTQEIISHLETHHNDSTFIYFQFPDTHPSWHFPPQTRYFQVGRRGNTSADTIKMTASLKNNIFDVPDQANQLYLLRLAELDRMFGSIFDYVDQHFKEEALVVVTADHGLRMPYIDEAYKNDEPFLTDVRVNIPLYIKGGTISNKKHDELCSPNIDLPVILLEQAGIKPASGNFDGVNIAESETNRKAVISEYAYNDVYEIAVRGEGHVLFLKYDIDDVNFKLLSREPIYRGLYLLGQEKYPKENNLIKDKPEIADKLTKIAYDHFVKTGIMEKI